MEAGHTRKGAAKNDAVLPDRMLVCSAACGWQVAQLKCTQCGGIIRSNHFKGATPVRLSRNLIVVAVLLAVLAELYHLYGH